MAIHAVKVDWATHGEQLRGIRARVFIEEQGVPKDLEWDGLDEDAHHFIALNSIGLAIGTSRLLPTGQIGRMAVLTDQRGKGIGRQLLDAAVRHAIGIGMPRVFLHAQRHAEGFYRKAGFLPTGLEMTEAGIPHLEMDMVLPVRFEPLANDQRPSLINPQRRSDDVRDSAYQSFDSEHECVESALAVVETARRTVLILSPTLDAALFGNARMISSVSKLARRSRSAIVRVLLEDPKSIAEAAHPLLELARRLPSKIDMRRLPDNDAPLRRSFVVVDGEAVWIQPDRDAYAGWSNTYDRIEARRLVEEFTALYERSAEDPHLRLLSL